MKTEKAIQILRDYNLWRRGNEDMEQPDPREIGEAIDSVLVTIQKAEADLDEERKEGEEQARLLGMGSERECDLRGKLDRERALADQLGIALARAMEIIPDPDELSYTERIKTLRWEKLITAWKEARSERR